MGICARDAVALDAVAAELRQAGVRAVATVADLTDADAVHDAVHRTVDATGRLDILIVNAGGPAPGRFEEVDDQAWRQAYELILLSAVHLVREALPALRRSDAASILFLASMSVKQPIDNLLLSNSVRAAVNGFAKSLAAELAPAIRVNSILTGRIRTGRTEALARHNHPADDVESVLAREAEAIPLRRFGTVEELARVAAFLCSPAASYVTGVALAVDGGVVRSAL